MEAVFELQVGGNSKTMIDGGDDVGGKDRAAAGMGADFVAGAMDIAAPDAASGEHDGVTKIPVIASGGAGGAPAGAAVPRPA